MGFKNIYIYKSSLNDNPNLSVKMIRFGNSTIDNCNFNNINILCYEPQTCKSINFNNKEFSDAKAQKYFKICTKEEEEELNENIGQKEISNDLNQEENQNNVNLKDNKLKYILIIVLGCVVVIAIGILVTFMFIKKPKNKKQFKLSALFNFNLNNGINNNTQNKNVMVNLNDVMKDVYRDESYSFSYSASPSFS